MGVSCDVSMARPKSASLMEPSVATSRFSGLMSLWIMPCEVCVYIGRVLLRV